MSSSKEAIEYYLLGVAGCIMTFPPVPELRQQAAQQQQQQHMMHPMIPPRIARLTRTGTQL